MTQFNDQLAQVQGPEWLSAKRRESLELFTTLEVPQESVEAWKYTRVDVDFDALRPHGKRDVVSDVSALPASVQEQIGRAHV